MVEILDPTAEQFLKTLRKLIEKTRESASEGLVAKQYL